MVVLGGAIVIFPAEKQKQPCAFPGIAGWVQNI
jgi:hypothetical protein